MVRMAEMVGMVVIGMVDFMVVVVAMGRLVWCEWGVGVWVSRL